MKRVAPGDRLVIPAKTFNAFVDVAEAYQRDRATLGSVPDARATTVWVRNDTSVARDRFDAVGVDVPIILPGDNLVEFLAQVAFAGVVPTADHVGGRWALLLDPLAPGAIGRACLAGAAIARVRRSAATDQYCDVEADSCRLVSASAGPAQILWIEPVDVGQEAWAIIRIGAGGAGSQTRWFARLTDSTAIDGVENAWAYDWVEVTLNADRTTTDVIDGRTGTVANGTEAYNTLELNSSDAGVQPSGVDADALPPGWAFVPIGDGAVVEMWSVAGRAWFSTPLSVDGSCV